MKQRTSLLSKYGLAKIFSKFKYLSACCCLRSIIGSVCRSNDLAALISRNSINSITIFIYYLRRNIKIFWEKNKFRSIKQNLKSRPTCSYKSMSLAFGNLREEMIWSTVSQWPLLISEMKDSMESTVFNETDVSSFIYFFGEF